MNKTRLIYIEDDAKQREALEQSLRKKGFLVSAMPSGERGLAQLQESGADAVVCDLRMPDLNGMEVSQRSLEIVPDLPFILLTANATLPEAIKTLQTGAFDFLQKPVDIDHLENSIRNAIERKKLENELKNYSKNLEIIVRERTDKLEYTNLQLTALNDVSNAFTQIFDEETLFDEVPHLLCHSLDFDRSCLFLQQNNQLKVRSFCFEKDIDLAKAFNEHFKAGTIPVPRPVSDSFQSCKTILLNKPEDLPLWPQFTSEPAQIKAVIITTLRVQNACIGVIVASMQDHEREMDAQDIARFEMFARMVGLALDNIHAYQTLEKKVIERTQSLRELNKKLRSQTKALEKANYALGKSNVELLAIQEELVQKNEELTKKEEELRTAIDTSPIPYVMTDASTGRVLYTNKPLCDIVGLPAEKVIGNVTSQLYHRQEDREYVLSQLQKHGRLENFELQVRQANGNAIWMLLSVVSASMGGKSILLGALYNIDERKRAEQALRESEMRFRQLTESINDVFWMRDGKSKELIYVNPAFERVYGRSIESHYDDPDAIIEMTHPEDKAMLIEKIQTGLQDEKPFEFRIIRQSDQAVRWLRARTFPIRNEQGEIIRIGGVTQDLTDRIEAELAMKESEARFRSLVENASDLIYTILPDGKISYVSPNCKELIGYEVADLTDRPYTDFIYPEDNQILSSFFAEVIETGERQHSPEHRLRHKDGSWRWYISNAAPLKDDEGEVLSIIGIAHDVTEQKVALEALEKSNQELRDTQSQLVQSEKMAALGNLVAGIAHEINTPVGAISSMHNTAARAVEILREFVEQKLAEEQQENRKLVGALKIIQDSNNVIKSGTERVINIVRRLRSFARLDEAEVKDANIHEGIEDTLTLAHHELKHRVTVHKKFGNLPAIACFPGRLNQVFLNMVINASQAIKDKGEITITTYLKNQKAFIEIKDTGVGISPEHLKKIFDPGFTTKGVGVGTGLGLSICYQIIKDHHGEIKVESEIGKGTTFTIILPTDLDKRLGVS